MVIPTLISVGGSWYRNAPKTSLIYSVGFILILDYISFCSYDTVKYTSCMCSQIICNDCQARSTVSFHVLGMKCSSCGSYNTAQDGGLIAAPPVDARQTLEEEPNTENHEWCLCSEIICYAFIELIYRIQALLPYCSSLKSVELLLYFMLD